MINNSTILGKRLHNQRFSSSKFEKPEQAIFWVVGSQAQDYIGALWAVGLRMRTATGEPVEHAFQAGRILQTQVLRPSGALRLLHIFTVIYFLLAIFGTFTRIHFGIQLELEENALHWPLSLIATAIAIAPRSITGKLPPTG